MKVWIVDGALCIIVLVGFEIIDRQIIQLQGLSFYYDYLVTAKWLLVAGFAIHGIANWLTHRRSND